MHKKKMLIVINPVSGKGKAKKYALDIISAFSKENYDVTVYPTVSKEKTVKYLVKNAYNYDTVVCCGGDGTFSQTVNGIVRFADPPLLGYIPLGTTNDVAKTYGISLNPMKCVRDIIRGTPCTMDVGLFNRKPFAYVAATGAFVNASFTTSPEMKRMLGHMAYIIEGITELTKIKPLKLRVEFDGKVIEDEFIYASFSNSTSVAGILSLDDVKTNDGIFELTLVKNPASVNEMTEIITDALNSKFNEKMIKVFRASSVTITSNEKLEWTLDGEYGGAYKKAVIGNMRRAIKLIK